MITTICTQIQQIYALVITFRAEEVFESEMHFLTSLNLYIFLITKLLSNKL